MHQISVPKFAGVGRGTLISAVTHVIRTWGLLVYTYSTSDCYQYLWTYQTQPKFRVSGMPLPPFPKAVNWLLGLRYKHQTREVTICHWSALVLHALSLSLTPVCLCDKISQQGRMCLLLPNSWSHWLMTSHVTSLDQDPPLRVHADPCLTSKSFLPLANLPLFSRFQVISS